MSDGLRDADRPFSSQKGADLTSTPLDLRAVEARIAEIEADPRYQSGLQRPATVFENAPLALIQLGFEQELLALKQLALPVVSHARALRAALQEMLDQHYHWHPDMGPTRAERAAAVLAAAQDGPA